MRKYTDKFQWGFTLLEVLVAIGILAFAVAMASSSLVMHLKANAAAEVRFEAAQAAQTVIDELRYEDVKELPSEGTDDAREVSVKSNRTYDVYVNYCSDETYCTSNEVRHIAVRVAYKNATVFRTETVFTALEQGSGSDADDDDDDDDPLWATPTPTPSPTPSPSPTSSGGGGGGGRPPRCWFWWC